MMKAKTLKMLAAILTFCGTMCVNLTSCTEGIDNPVNPNQTQLKEELVGTWFSMLEADEGYYEIPGKLHEITYINLEADGKGSYLFFLVDENLEVIDDENTQFACAFEYTTTADGKVLVSARKAIDDFELERNITLSYDNGHLLADDGEYVFKMDHPSDMQKSQMTIWLDQLHFGGAAASYYNINDESFTTENWRTQEAIYIYDGQGKDVVDEQGRTGYTLVNMPWYMGDKLTNLPNDFCDDLLPENGWEWVINRCGSRTIMNNNFFAVYNKYTGILRFFYYLPYGFSSGNDHVWQIAMTDHLAQGSTWRYGIPMDKTIIDKNAIKQEGSGTYMEYVTPWVDYKSDDGLIVPNAGWWAFDVDLSSYRNEDIKGTDNIKLQMRSWSTQHVSLTSTVAAAINGKLTAGFDITKRNVTVNSAKGITQSLGDIKDLGQTIYGAVQSAIKGDYISALKTGFTFAKGAYNLYGAMTKETSTTVTVDTIGKGNLTGTIALNMTGNIDTEGTIRGSAPVVGIASPTFYLKDFDTTNSHLGQGTWNLKTSPVVYLTDTRMVAHDNLEEGKTCPWQYNNGKDVVGGYPRFGYVYFFDPSSIEVSLNPNIFPEDQIEWMQVDALAGTRFSKNEITGTDAYRQALGLSSRSLERGGWEYKRDFSDGALYGGNIITDFFYKETENNGFTFPVYGTPEMINGVYDAVYGRGEDGVYIVEPMNAASNYLKARFIGGLEISVTVTIKLKGKKTPFVYNRVYLPEVKDLSYTDESLDGFYNRIKNHQLSPLRDGHRAIYDYQVKRIGDMITFIKSKK